jgi:hypothetical protein
MKVASGPRKYIFVLAKEFKWFLFFCCVQGCADSYHLVRHVLVERDLFCLAVLLDVFLFFAHFLLFDWWRLCVSFDVVHVSLA